MSDKQKQVLENTFHYIENYLDPSKKWDKALSLKERIKKIKDADVNWQTISKYIQGMHYYRFLKTPYWKAIAEHTKYKAGYRCQLCNSAQNLATHHRSYEIHGREHAYMRELTVICNNCHSKFHDKIPKPILKKRISARLLLKLTLVGVLFYSLCTITPWPEHSAYLCEFKKRIFLSLKNIHKRLRSSYTNYANQ